ncbi:MAG: hypothetical protein KDA91_21000 [Planctomycetaceae bacterium]|nr:hypothetical protein [Planctomycetaceae bacterium]
MQNEGIQIAGIPKTYSSIGAAKKFFLAVPTSRIQKFSATLTPGSTIEFQLDAEFFYSVALKGTLDDQNLIKIMAALCEVFDFVSKSDCLLQNFPEELRRPILAAEASYRAFSEQTATLGRYLAESAMKQEEFQNGLTERNQSHLLALEERLQDEHEKRVKVLDERERELDLKQDQLKLWEHRSVRRTILEQIEKKTDEHKTFKVSDEAKKYAYQMVLALVFIALTSAGMIATSVYLLVTQKSDSYLAYAPMISGSVLLCSTCVYAIRWLNDRNTIQTTAEFENARFAKDVLRSSWLAELTLEAKNPTRPGAEPFDIPEFLLEQFAQGLFESGASSKTDHPIEDLQRYAKQFKKLTVGPVSIESKDSGVM